MDTVGLPVVVILSIVQIKYPTIVSMSTIFLVQQNLFRSNYSDVLLVILKNFTLRFVGVITVSVFQFLMSFSFCFWRLVLWILTFSSSFLFYLISSSPLSSNNQFLFLYCIVLFCVLRLFTLSDYWLYSKPPDHFPPINDYRTPLLVQNYTFVFPFIFVLVQFSTYFPYRHRTQFFPLPAIR